MRVNAQPIRLRLLLRVVPAVPHEGPSESFAYEDGAQIIPVPLTYLERRDMRSKMNAIAPVEAIAKPRIAHGKAKRHVV